MKNSNLFLKLILLLLIVWLPLLAVDSNPSYESQIIRDEDIPYPYQEELKQAEIEGDSKFFGEFMKMLFYLGALVTLILGLTWVMRKMMLNRLHHANLSSSITILEQRPLTPKSALYLVQIRNKIIAIGESPYGLTALAEFPAPSENSFEQVLDEKSS